MEWVLREWIGKDEQESGLGKCEIYGNGKRK